VLVAGVAVALLLIIISFRSPATGLCFYIIWVFTRPPEIIPGFGGALPLTRILAVGLIAAAFLNFKVFRPRPFVSNPLNLALLAFLFANYLSALPGLSIGQSVSTTNEFLTTVALYFLMVNLLDTPARLRQCLWFYVAGMAWVTLSGLRDFKGPVGDQLARAQAGSITFGNANNTAEQLVLVLPFVFALMMTERKLKTRLVLVAFVAADLALLVHTGSRGGILELIALLIFYAFQSKRSFAVVSVVGVLLFASFFALPSAYKERYATLPSVFEDPKSADNSAYGRLVGWYVAWEIFKDRPFSGVGAGNFPRAFERVYSYKGAHGWFEPHNLPGQVLGELGLLGAFTFGAYVFVFFREGSKANRQYAESSHLPELLPWVVRGSRVAVLTLFVVGISDHPMYFVNWYMAGAFVVVVKQLLINEKEKGTQALPQSEPAAARRVGSQREVPKLAFNSRSSTGG
jgi:O-antigen ligase